MTFAKEIAETRVISSFQSRSLELELELEQEQDQDKREEGSIALLFWLYRTSLLMKTVSGSQTNQIALAAIVTDGPGAVTRCNPGEHDPFPQGGFYHGYGTAFFYRR